MSWPSLLSKRIANRCAFRVHASTSSFMSIISNYTINFIGYSRQYHPCEIEAATIGSRLTTRILLHGSRRLPQRALKRSRPLIRLGHVPIALLLSAAVSADSAAPIVSTKATLLLAAALRSRFLIMLNASLLCRCQPSTYPGWGPVLFPLFAGL
jgi:hypothetical protein